MSLDEILEQAETATSPPKDPPGGIPKQKLPSWIRWAFLSFNLPFLYLELLADKVAKWIVRPPFSAVGNCKRRGNCCYYILLPDTKGLLEKLVRFWHTEVYGFYPREKTTYDYEGSKVHVMGCRYLRQNGSCSKYFFRPKVCRSWPLIDIFGTPRILKGCGYQAKVRKSYAKKYPSLRVLNDPD